LLMHVLPIFVIISIAAKKDVTCLHHTVSTK